MISTAEPLVLLALDMDDYLVPSYDVQVLCDVADDRGSVDFEWIGTQRKR